MEGVHPFDGQYLGGGDPPERQDRIRLGLFPHSDSRDSLIRPKRIAPPLNVLEPSLQVLFRDAIQWGHGSPETRPGPRQWREALGVARKRLVVCAANNQHRYGGHLNGCPWCERRSAMAGLDPFPAVADVRAGRHLRNSHAPQPSPRRAAPAAQPIPTAAPPPQPVIISRPRRWPEWVGTGVPALVGAAAIAQQPAGLRVGLRLAQPWYSSSCSCGILPKLRSRLTSPLNTRQ